MEFEESAMHSLRDHFSSLGDGTLQRPRVPIYSDIIDTIADPEIKEYIKNMIFTMGPLFSHFVASVPYILEELARIGVAICNLEREFRGKRNSKYFNFIEIEAFDGTNACVLGNKDNIEISTLTCSPNANNQKYFQLHPKKHSFFKLCSYLEIRNENFLFQSKNKNFANGFDFVYEMAGFQFYDKNRDDQISCVKKIMKDSGIFIFLEKLNCEEIEEYEFRESVKDKKYKTRYFSEEEILWKKTMMLSQMNQGQVTKNELISSLKRNFNHVYLIWNSTNFFEFAASNCEITIKKFIDIIGKPNIPADFVFEENILCR